MWFGENEDKRWRVRLTISQRCAIAYILVTWRDGIWCVRDFPAGFFRKIGHSLQKCVGMSMWKQRFGEASRDYQLFVS